tara:strand:+ start:370 stop:471 length:102 start_codon:yes stop_codon:yes gene_type:complete
MPRFGKQAHLAGGDVAAMQQGTGLLLDCGPANA